jgi:hypothetical protein
MDANEIVLEKVKRHRGRSRDPARVALGDTGSL